MRRRLVRAVVAGGVCISRRAAVQQSAGGWRGRGGGSWVAVEEGTGARCTRMAVLREAARLLGAGLAVAGGVGER